MRRILFLLFMLLPFTANAQFKLVPGGMTTGTDKPYLIVKMEGTQSELFNKAKTALISMYVSPKDVLSYNEPEIITVNGCAIDAIKMHYVRDYMATMNYRLEFRFKDGKIRIDTPEITSLTAGSNHGTIIPDKGGTQYIWKKNGEERISLIVNNIQDHINNLIGNILKHMEPTKSDNDW